MEKRPHFSMDNMRVLRSRDAYSWAALVLILLGEAFAYGGIQFGWCLWGPLAIATLLLIFIIGLIGRCSHYKFGMRSVILTKLLANAVTPRPLGTLYLFFFVTHIGWFTNAVMSLFTPGNQGDVLLAVLICLIGIFVLTAFFPDGRQVKENPIKVFVSGISSFPGVPAPGQEGNAPLPRAYSSFNLIPLVRVLQEITPEMIEKGQKCELLILQTTELANKVPTPYFQGFERFRFDEYGKEECKKYGITPENDNNDKLRLIIKKTAIEEFPDKESWIKSSLDINFTTPCNYNVFKTCFEVMSKQVKELDKPDRQLNFNVTPGTAVVSTVMTLLSIHSNRGLYYYSQDRTIPEDRKWERLQDTGKGDIQLQGLLSQALETLEDSNN